MSHAAPACTQVLRLPASQPAPVPERGSHAVDAAPPARHCRPLCSTVQLNLTPALSCTAAGWVTHEIVHFIANDSTMAQLAASGLGGRELSIIDLDEARSARSPPMARPFYGPFVLDLSRADFAPSALLFTYLGLRLWQQRAGYACCHAKARLAAAESCYSVR